MAGPQGLIPVIDQLEMKNNGLGVTTRLGLEDSGGMVRVGLVHFNPAPVFTVRSPRTQGNAGGDPTVWGGAQ